MATKRPIDRGQKAKQRGPEMARGGYTSWKHLTCCHLSRISTSLNCLVNWMNGMRASFSLSLENQKSIVWRHSSNTTQAGGYECHHPLLLTSNEKTGDLSLDKKQGQLFAQWPLATPGHTFTSLHSSTPKQQGSNTWCQAHPPPLYLCRGGGRAHHHHSTFTPPPPDPVSSPPTSSVSL